MATALGRRRFLKALVALLGATVGGAGGLRLLRGPVPRVAGLKVLTRGQYGTLSKLAQALFPASGPIPTGDLDLARAADLYLADAPAWTRRELPIAVELLEYGPLLFERRLTTFSRLSQEARLRHFESCLLANGARRRQAALGLKRLLSVIFYDRPAVWPRIGYDGPIAIR